MRNFTYYYYYYVDELKEDEILETQTVSIVYLKNLKGNLGIDGKIMLKWILKK
jgi:hypothetical protein